PALNNVFAAADLKYNSSLFTSEDWMIALTIEDKILNEIIDEMYPPKCPYEFSVLPIEILGHAYEQFLGKTIRFSRKTKYGHAVEIEEKPEVRKAGGVYYTPDYIVRYIVEHTVGEKVKGKTPVDIAPLKILDPACGSGSFLIGAYDFLLHYHLEYYLKNKSRREKALSAGIIYEAGADRYRLSSEVKSKILVNNIYGVDIDPQAVEVTKLSLLLKVLEDENLEYREQLFKTEQMHLLPDLSSNIKCGNSLIGKDYYGDKNMDLFGTTEMRKVNVFDWEEAFVTSPPSPLRGGEGGPEWGFDCVIGNPPYVRQEALGEEFKRYAKKYETFAGTADLYVFFIEKAHKLLKEGGLFGYIVANKWMRANYGKALRTFVASKTTIRQIIDFGELPVFQGASTFPAIVITENSTPEGKQSFTYAPIKTLNFDTLENEIDRVGEVLSENALGADNWTLASEESVGIIEKMKQAGVPLGEYVGGKIFYGIKTGLNEAFVIDESTKDRLIAEDPKSAEIIKLFLGGRDIKRYAPLEAGKYLILIPRGWTMTNGGNDRTAWNVLTEKYPAIAEHLKQYEAPCSKRYDKGDYWWELRACDYYDEFEKEKIIYAEIGSRNKFNYDEKNFYGDTTSFILGNNSKHLLGILNSKLTLFFVQKTASVLGDVDKGGRLRWKKQYMAPLPIVEQESPELVKAVTSMLEAQRQLQSAKSDADRKTLQQKIDAIDSQIDRLVYDLYGLTDEEVRIVEGRG
ncbi:MAG TPA: TaqI-like C-terminal specificity domain-containing protein, partial [Spirochaetota bacterium]|nr:TaqI-like C-terminal specificity domain-containing protein [Spirochaetota bacterium]